MFRNAFFRCLSLAIPFLLASLACNLLSRANSATSTSQPQALITQPAQITAEGTEAPPVPSLMASIQPAAPEAGSLKVAYTSQDNLYLWMDGKSHKLTDTGDVYNPVISPDGELVAYFRPADDFHLEIWAIQADGAKERKLVSVADMDAIAGGVRDSSAIAVNPFSPIAWLPDSHTIAFTSQQVFQGPGQNLLNDLNLVDADTGRITNLFLSGWGGMFAFSPDGKQVAISQPDKIILAHADGSNYRTVLPYDPVNTYAEYRYYASPVWSPASDFLMIALPPVDPLAQPPQPTELWRIPADDSPAQKLGTVQAVAFQEQPVKFSPDLKRIAFLQEVGQPEENLRELHLAAMDGSGDWMVAKAAPILFQSWSPDSIHFAYSTGQGRETWIGSLSEAPQPLGADFLGAQNLNWVDTSQFLFWLSNENAYELYLGDQKGGATQLDRTFDSRPDYTFSNNG